MILVDSSVWVDYFRPGLQTRQTQMLDRLLPSDPMLIGDLILTEVLQGFRDDRDFKTAQQLLSALRMARLGGKKISIQAARNYRKLRAQGITPRKTIDTIIATWCIENGVHLLHNDRDFIPFSEHLGLLAL
ncbi:ribonuclease VapC [Duganella rhizosphaerae]|uniref:type II toxin-antitoxin system VapC family toxin n=1 Tax=Duganella rhizosphaerae TaxID=2885763 RepID=UPI0030E9CA53